MNEFIEGGEELEAQPGPDRAGGPPGKSTLAGLLDSRNCPRCGKRFPSEVEESAMKKTRAKDPDGWETLRGKISRKVCTCGDTASPKD